MKKSSFAETFSKPQMLLAAPFIVGGAVCVLAPRQTLRLSMTRGDVLASDSSARLLIACFGAQALLVGTLCATSRFTKTTWRAMTCALVPFFAFNYAFSPIGPFPLLQGAAMACDFAGNVFMTALCAKQAADAEEEEKS